MRRYLSGGWRRRTRRSARARAGGARGRVEPRAARNCYAYAVPSGAAVRYRRAPCVGCNHFSRVSSSRKHMYTSGYLIHTRGATALRPGGMANAWWAGAHSVPLGYDPPHGQRHGRALRALHLRDPSTPHSYVQREDRTRHERAHTCGRLGARSTMHQCGRHNFLQSTAARAGCAARAMDT